MALCQYSGCTDDPLLPAIQNGFRTADRAARLYMKISRGTTHRNMPHPMPTVISCTKGIGEGRKNQLPRQKDFSVPYMMKNPDAKSLQSKNGLN
jgi:hypothetical protein